MPQQYRVEAHLSFPEQVMNMSLKKDFKSKEKNAEKLSLSTNILILIKRVIFQEEETLITVQFEYAPGDHGFGLKSLRGIPFGTLLTGA